MSEIWEEVKAFERNLFKAGDSIKVYTEFHPNGIVAVVANTLKATVMYSTEEGSGKAHFKCCRLMRSRVRQRYWIKKGDAFSIGRGVMNHQPIDSSEWIRVVEDV